MIEGYHDNSSFGPEKICRLQGMWVEHKHIFSGLMNLEGNEQRHAAEMAEFVGKNSREKGVA